MLLIRTKSALYDSAGIRFGVRTTELNTNRTIKRGEVCADCTDGVNQGVYNSCEQLQLPTSCQSNRAATAGQSPCGWSDDDVAGVTHR